MSKKILVYSRKKKTKYVISPEDINMALKEFTYLSNPNGVNLALFAFPKIEMLGMNCFYSDEHINLRISNSIVQKQLELFLKGMSQGFFLEFKLIGLGFKVRRGVVNCLKCIEFDIGFSHFINLILPPAIKFLRTKKRFMLFAYDHELLQNILKNVRSIRKHNPYKARGLKATGLKVRLKLGKKQNKR